MFRIECRLRAAFRFKAERAVNKTMTVCVSGRKRGPPALGL
jgi:hypothetical protein